MGVGTESCGLKTRSLSAHWAPGTELLAGGNEGEVDMILVHRQLPISWSRKARRYVHC